MLSNYGGLRLSGIVGTGSAIDAAVGAIAWLDLAIQTDPDFAPAYNNRGEAHRLAGDAAEAITDFEAASLLHPNSYTPAVNLGNALVMAGEFGRAITAYDRAIALEPNEPEAFLGRAIAARETGALDRAREDLEWVRLFAPDLPELHRELAALAHAETRYSDMLAHLADFERAVPDPAAREKVREQLAVICRELATEAETAKDRARQADMLEGYVTYAPPSRERDATEAHLSLLQEAVGEEAAAAEDYDSAIARLQRAAAHTPDPAKRVTLENRIEALARVQARRPGG
jgi:tetratricopeptide (TPR) repeat protein